MPRISQLTSLTTPENADEIAIVDTSASVTKKITRGDLLSGAPLPADTVDTQAIEDGSVTTAKQADGSTTNRKIDLLSAAANISFASIGNYGTTEIVAGSVTTTIPAGCNKVLIIGSTRLQAQDATSKDIMARVDQDSSGSLTTPSFIFTASNTYQSANVALVDEMTTTPGSHTFRLLVRTSAGSANAGTTRVKIIPVYG